MPSEKSSSIDSRSKFYRESEKSTNNRLRWLTPPKTVLVIQKLNDAEVMPTCFELIEYLLSVKCLNVMIESSVMDTIEQENLTNLKKYKNRLKTFDTTIPDDQSIDLIICLGGDGTLLYASSLFQAIVPPVMAFHLGSLGFLAPFDFDSYKQQVSYVLDGRSKLTLRSRLSCYIHRYRGSRDETNLVLNEVVIDRGVAPFLCNLELFIDGKFVTTVQGDGLIVSAPTGSTAYAVAAGASMIHPSVPAIMLTPICPHSLSFRPIVVPADIELKILVSMDSRNSAWVSFDGRKRQELHLGDELTVTASNHPLPSICASDSTTDWFTSLGECLHWNERKRQKQFNQQRSFERNNSIA